MRTGWLAGALMLASATGAGAQAAKKDYPAEAPVYYVTCLRERAAAVDDKVSDAATIATVIVPYCRTRQLAYMQEVAPTSEVTALLKQPARPQDMKVGIDIVLQVRAKARR